MQTSFTMMTDREEETGPQTPDDSTLPLGLAVKTLHTEGLDLHLHARHQSNIGCFLHLRVSDVVQDQVGKGDKFELWLKRTVMGNLSLVHHSALLNWKLNMIVENQVKPEKALTFPEYRYLPHMLLSS
ncbi:hypothetical protein BTVI_116134 [Pitangus sulphuratus]|nr:hypothetical protein BTVI_116134 [Pitangus sulphuratus]